MDKENILYYQSNIKTSRDEDRVYAMKYANQQMLIDKLEQQCKKQKEIINKAIEYINENLIISSILDGKKYYTISDYSFDYRELLDILNEVTNNE